MPEGEFDICLQQINQANPSPTPLASRSNLPTLSSTFELTSSIHPKLTNCSFKTLTTSPNKSPGAPLLVEELLISSIIPPSPLTHSSNSALTDSASVYIVSRS